MDNITQKVIPVVPKWKYTHTTIYKDCTYAITLTLTPENTNMNKKREAKDALEKIFKAFKYMGRLSLYIEQHESGVSHFHGTFKCTDNIKWYKTLDKNTQGIGRMKVKKMDDPEIWQQYSEKEQEIMEEVYECKLPITTESYWNAQIEKNKAKHLATLTKDNPLAIYNVITSAPERKRRGQVI